MKFATWFNEAIDREEIKNIILDAVGGSQLSPQQQGSVLGSQLSEQPNLLKKLGGYERLGPFYDKIQEFFGTHQNANLMSLIDFISQLDRPLPPQQTISTNPMV